MAFQHDKTYRPSTTQGSAFFDFLGNKMRILTVDVEDWFHILDHPQTAAEDSWKQFEPRVEAMTISLLDLFGNHDKKATFFVLGYVAQKHPELVQEIVRRGHEVGTHSHLHQLVYNQSPDEFEADLVRSMDAIVRAGAHPPRCYRAPGFSITQDALWAFDVLARNGIEVDCSIFPARRAHGGLPNFPHGNPCIIEAPNGQALRAFPMSSFSIAEVPFVFSGGGYFRLAPGGLINLLTSRSKYMMTYFHPRDFDPSQPIAPALGAIRKFKSYVGLSTARSKLHNLLNSFEFISVEQAESLVDWDKAPRVTFDA